MDVKDYCNNVQMELNTWKARLFDIICKIEALPASDREKMKEEIVDINMIVSQLDDRIENLRSNCPTSWEPQKDEIAAKVGTLSDKYEELWHYPGLGKDTSKPAP
jgi:hypothetical protein